MTCANCGVQRDSDAFMCANCGSTNLVAPPPAIAPPGSQVVHSIVRALVGIVAGVFVGGLLGFATAFVVGVIRRSDLLDDAAVPIAVGVEVLAIIAFAAGAARAFHRRAYPVGWLLAGIAFGIIGPATTCWLGLASYGGVRPH